MGTKFKLDAKSTLLFILLNL